MAEPADDTRPTLTSADLVAGVPVVVLAVVATASLAWAHAHHHSLPAVLLTSLVVLAALGWGVLRFARPAVRHDRNGLVAVVAGGLLAGVMFLPGFSYGVADKDPGSYVAHAVKIARDGSYSYVDPALAHGDLFVVEETPNARFPAQWIRDRDRGLIVPQFYHLWPSLLATMYDVAGFGGITFTTPLCGILAVMLLVALLRRVGGLPAAAFGAVLLATNMLEVWQAKFPSSEVFSQALFLGAVYAVVVAAQTRWRPAAFVAGMLAGVGFLNRADGWLLVMLAAGTLGALWVSRRADGETLWGAAGLGVVLPYALFQAYATARAYTYDNGVPGFKKTVTLLAVVAVVAVAARLVLKRPVAWLTGLSAQRRTQLVAGLAVCAGCFLLLLVGFLRPKLFGPDYVFSRNKWVRSYDERSLIRLSWFLTLPGFALAGLGVPVVALRRWRTAAWAAILPTLFLTPLFALHAKNSTRLMWWARRYVSNVLPGLVVLMALALGFAWVWQWRGRKPLRIPALLAAGGLVAVFLSQSLPLRSHDEWGGSFGVSEKVAAVAGKRHGVYLWQRGTFCCTHPTTLWAVSTWLERGQLSVLLPTKPEQLAPYVHAYQQAFPGDPMYVVWHGTEYPPGLESLHLQARLHLAGTMPFWQESDIERPHFGKRVKYDFVVWQVP